MLTLTFYFDTPWYNLKSDYPVVMKVPFHQFLLVEVQDEGQVVVQIKLGGRKKENNLTLFIYSCLYSLHMDYITNKSGPLMLIIYIQP